jgi:hypothetical protein
LFLRENFRTDMGPRSGDIGINPTASTIPTTAQATAAGLSRYLKWVDENGTFVGCFTHRHKDARTGGTIFPDKGEPFLACLECVEDALKAGLTVRRFGHEQVNGDDVERPAPRQREAPPLTPHFPYRF